MSDDQTITVRVPIAFSRQRGRKRVMTSDGSHRTRLPQANIDHTLVKALARAHRWQRMLDEGEYATLQEIGAAERISPS